MEKVCIHLEHATSVSEDDEEAWNAEKARLNDLTHNGLFSNSIKDIR